MTIQRKVGEQMSFTGGAEDTPLVTVSKFIRPFSLHHGDKMLTIEQNGVCILLSPETMKAILHWAESK